MKNTQETIALPDFAVRLVYQSDSGMIDENIVLKEYLTAHKKGLILYFYPKDNTQGCSLQATDFSHELANFAQKGYVVIGVSRDGVKSHSNFIYKKELSIALISDTDEILCKYFDVIKEKMMYGKTHLGVVRSTFVFDKDGQMVASYRNVKAKDHVKTLLELL